MQYDERYLAMYYGLHGHFPGEEVWCLVCDLDDAVLDEFD